jgi:hypothetical protein
MAACSQAFLFKETTIILLSNKIRAKKSTLMQQVVFFSLDKRGAGAEPAAALERGGEPE